MSHCWMTPTGTQTGSAQLTLTQQKLHVISDFNVAPTPPPRGIYRIGLIHRKEAALPKGPCWQLQARQKSSTRSSSLLRYKASKLVYLFIWHRSHTASDFKTYRASLDTRFQSHHGVRDFGNAQWRYELLPTTAFSWSSCNWHKEQMEFISTWID